MVPLVRGFIGHGTSRSGLEGQGWWCFVPRGAAVGVSMPPYPACLEEGFCRGGSMRGVPKWVAVVGVIMARFVDLLYGLMDNGLTCIGSLSLTGNK